MKSRTDVLSQSPDVPFEAGDARTDPRGFRRCLAQYTTGVTVITAKYDDKLGGVTANSFASLSMDPPLVMWALQKTSQSFDVFSSSDTFAINILASDQIALSQKFAKSGPDKFTGVAFFDGLGGAPVLDGAAGVLECTCHALHDAGDHLLVVGHVEKFTRHERTGLAFENGRYVSTVEHPDMRRKSAEVAEGAEVKESSAAKFHQLLVNLLSRAYNHLRDSMDEARNSLGFDFNESRMLTIVSVYPGRSLDALLPLTFLGRRVAEDALANLMERGLVERVGQGKLVATQAGEDALEALMRETRAVEDKILGHLSENELELTRATLEKLVESDEFESR